MCDLCGKDCCEYCCEENLYKKYLDSFHYKIIREKKSNKEIETLRDLMYAGTAIDYFYEKKYITPKIELLPPIPMESSWSLRPFICGYHINRFRIIEGDKVVSVVLTHDNLTELYYDVLPLKKLESQEKRFSVEDVNELHNYIKLIFEKWSEV